MTGHRVSNPRYTYVTTTFSEAEAKALAEWMAKQDPPVAKSVAVRLLVRAALDLKD